MAYIVTIIVALTFVSLDVAAHADPGVTDRMVLNALSEQHGFVVRGIEKIGPDDRSLGDPSGRLEPVLRRLLRNRNYKVIRSPDRRIEAVEILDSTSGARQRPVSQPTPDVGAELLGVVTGASNAE
jgi:hypothetical protein